MKFFYFLFILHFHTSSFALMQGCKEDDFLATFLRSGLHNNHYWECDHTALVEVSETKEKETDLGNGPVGCRLESRISFNHLPNRFSFSNPINLQRVGRSIFALHRNYRL